MSIHPPSLVGTGLESKEELFSQLVKDMLISIAEVITTRAYISIVDALGNFQYLDTPVFDEYLCFIQNYVQENFQALPVGECTIPFGGIALGFFKISEKAIVIIFLQKGPSAQLFALKTKLLDWAQKIDELVGELDYLEISTDIEQPIVQQPESEENQKPFLLDPSSNSSDTGSRRRKVVPLLIKPLNGKEKLPLEEINVLQYCDGIISLEEISRKLLYSLPKINKIIRKYEKKDWVKVQRI